MIRNCFVREEGDQLLIGSGILPEWLLPGKSISFGPALTQFGTLTVEIMPALDAASGCNIRWEAHWHDDAPPVRVCLPDHQIVEISKGEHTSAVTCGRNTM